jgi:hypothetical protein
MHRADAPAHSPSSRCESHLELGLTRTGGMGVGKTPVCQGMSLIHLNGGAMVCHATAAPPLLDLRCPPIEVRD